MSLEQKAFKFKKQTKIFAMFVTL